MVDLRWFYFRAFGPEPLLMFDPDHETSEGSSLVSVYVSAEHLSLRFHCRQSKVGVSSSDSWSDSAVRCSLTLSSLTLFHSVCQSLLPFSRLTSPMTFQRMFSYSAVSVFLTDVLLLGSPHVWPSSSICCFLLRAEVSAAQCQSVGHSGVDQSVSGTGSLGGEWTAPQIQPKREMIIIIYQK